MHPFAIDFMLMRSICACGKELRAQAIYVEKGPIAMNCSCGRRYEATVEVREASMVPVFALKPPQ